MNTFDGLFFLLARTWLAMKGNTKQERGTAEVHPCASTFKSVSVSYSTWSGDGRDTLRNNDYIKVSSGEVSTIKCTPWLVRLKPSTQVMRIRMPLPPPIQANQNSVFRVLIVGGSWVVSIERLSHNNAGIASWLL